jgi:hypothetical protein
MNFDTLQRPSYLQKQDNIQARCKGEGTRDVLTTAGWSSSLWFVVEGKNPDVIF